MKLKNKKFFSRFGKNLFSTVGLAAAIVVPFLVLGILGYIAVKNPVVGGSLIGVYLLIAGVAVATWNERADKNA